MPNVEKQTDKNLIPGGQTKANDVTNQPAPAPANLSNMTEVPKKAMADVKNAEGKATQWAKAGLNKGGSQRISD